MHLHGHGPCIYMDDLCISLMSRFFFFPSNVNVFGVLDKMHRFCIHCYLIMVVVKKKRFLQRKFLYESTILFDLKKE